MTEEKYIIIKLETCKFLYGDNFWIKEFDHEFITINDKDYKPLLEKYGNYKKKIWGRFACYGEYKLKEIDKKTNLEKWFIDGEFRDENNPNNVYLIKKVI